MKSLILSTLTFLCLTVPANSNALHLNPAQSASQINMNTFGQTSIPVGYYEFCKNYPERCGAKSDVITVELTRQSWRKMVDTNTLVNTEIAPMTDVTWQLTAIMRQFGPS